MRLGDIDPRPLGAAALAFIGDGVYELLARERLLSGGAMPARKLHGLAVKKVCASSQAKAYEKLLPALNEDETGILRRGRNLNTARVPKSCTVEEYRKATAVEALFGYLYLKGETGRIAALFALIDGGGEA